MMRQVKLAREHKSRPCQVEGKLSLTIHPASAVAQTGDMVTGQRQDKSVAAIESGYSGSAILIPIAFEGLEIAAHL